MADLRTLMHNAVSDITDPDESVVRRDLTLGRQALSRQRARRTRRRFLVPIGVAAATGLLGIAVLGIGPGSALVPPFGIGTVGSPGSPRIALVAYSGQQPQGFTIDAVPQGWTVQEINAGYVLIAPVGDPNQNDRELDGKVEIHVASKDELAVERAEKRPLHVGDVTATHFMFPDDDMVTDTTDEPKVGPGSAPGLLMPDGKETLLFQFPTTQDWDDATITTFAAGVHLTDVGRRVG